MRLQSYLNEINMKTTYDVEIDNPDDINDPFYRRINSLDDIKKFIKEIVKKTGEKGMEVRIWNTTNPYKKVNLKKPDKILKAK